MEGGGCELRHDEGSQESNGIAGGSITAQLGNKHPPQDLDHTGLGVGHLGEEATSHDQ